MARILVVDDEPMFRDYLNRVLEREGHAVIEASDGAQGLRRLDDQSVDLVLLDIVMPNMDGIEFLIGLRKRESDVGVIAMSGGGQPIGCYLTPANALGARQTLTKLFACSDLIGAVQDALDEVTPSRNR